MLKRIAYALTGLVATALIAIGATIPLVPSTSQYSEPSQIVGALNALVQQLNGQAGYAPAQVVALGSYGIISGATPQTLNTQRGIVSFTGVTIAGVSSAALVMNNSLVAANSACVASVVSDNSAAASFPYIRSVVPTAGVLTINMSNAAAATSTGSSTFGIAFNCIN
jgi:hypothetical protein